MGFLWCKGWPLCSGGGGVLRTCPICPCACRATPRADEPGEPGGEYSSSSRWGERADGGWSKERKPEPDFFLTAGITSLDDR